MVSIELGRPAGLHLQAEMGCAADGKVTKAAAEFLSG